MPGKSRREEYAAQTRAAVVAAAVERFAVDGYAATTIDAIAESARVAKGGVYHHFANKAELFEAAFIAMEERMLARVVAAIGTKTDPYELVVAGIDLFLAECRRPDFRRIALEEAPAALGWARWKEIDENYFLGLVRGGLADLSASGRYAIPPGDLPARVILAALTEAGLAVATAPKPAAELKRAQALMRLLLEGFAE